MLKTTLLFKQISMYALYLLLVAITRPIPRIDSKEVTQLHYWSEM
jgi:hypothetical protein